MESELELGAVFERIEPGDTVEKLSEGVAALDCCKVIFTHGRRTLICAIQYAPVEHDVWT